MKRELSQRIDRMLNAGTSEGVRKGWATRKGGYSTVTMPSTVGDDDVNVEFEHDPGENGSPSVGESVSLTSVKDKSGKDLLHTLTPQQKDAIHKEIWAYKAKLSKDVSNVACKHQEKRLSSLAHEDTRNVKDSRIQNMVFKESEMRLGRAVSLPHIQGQGNKGMPTLAGELSGVSGGHG